MTTKPTESETQVAAVNTDRELWREREGDYYADSIHATERGLIGINCEGYVFVKPVREWHALERQLAAVSHERDAHKLRADLVTARYTPCMDHRDKHRTGDRCLMCQLDAVTAERDDLRGLTNTIGEMLVDADKDEFRSVTISVRDWLKALMKCGFKPASTKAKA